MKDYHSSVKYLSKTTCGSVGKNVEETEPSYTVGGNVNWCSH